jgi:3-dehydroquinate dehydratase-2
VLIDKIAALADAKIDGLILNGGAFTHTSVALRDALAGAHIPTVEVHISNLYKREEFRHVSLTAPIAVAVITGLGLEGYFAAVRYFLKK